MGLNRHLNTTESLPSKEQKSQLCAPDTVAENLSCIENILELEFDSLNRMENRIFLLFSRKEKKKKYSKFCYIYSKKLKKKLTNGEEKARPICVASKCIFFSYISVNNKTQASPSC